MGFFKEGKQKLKTSSMALWPLKTSLYFSCFPKFSFFRISVVMHCSGCGITLLKQRIDKEFNLEQILIPHYDHLKCIL